MYAEGESVKFMLPFKAYTAFPAFPVFPAFPAFPGVKKDVA